MRKRHGDFAGLLTLCLASATMLLSMVSGVVTAAENSAADIVVTFLSGNVSVTHQSKNAVRVGAKLSLPAAIRTGGDGTIELRQARTTVTVAANSTLDIPVTGLISGKVDRVIQSSGSVFYRVEPREAQKLRVETPYLVAVIKGTQFNVVVQPDSATVALFEGLLQIDTPDNADSVDLNAGEIATRFGTEPRIRILRMNTGETLRAQLAAPANTVDRTAAAAPAPVAPRLNGALAVVNAGGAASDATGGAQRANTNATTSGPGEASANASLLVGNAKASVGGPSTTGRPANVTANIGTNVVGVGANVGLNNGVATVNASTGVNVGPAAIDVGSSIGIENGTANVSGAVGVQVGNLGTSVDVSANANSNVGTAAVNASASAGVAGTTASLATGSNLSLASGAALNTSVNASVAGATAPINSSTSVNLNAGSSINNSSSTVNAGAAVDATTTVGSTSVGVAIAPAVNVSGGSVSVATSVDTVLGGTSASSTLSTTPAVAASVGANANTINASVDVGAINLGVSVPLDTGLLGSPSPASGPAAATPSTNNDILSGLRSILRPK